MQTKSGGQNGLKWMGCGSRPLAWLMRQVVKADFANRPQNYIYTVFEYIEGQTLAQ
jgi:hypothetical protein